MPAVRGRIGFTPTYHRLLAELQGAAITPLTDVIEVQRPADAESISL